MRNMYQGRGCASFNHTTQIQRRLRVQKHLAHKTISFLWRARGILVRLLRWGLDEHTTRGSKAQQIRKSQSPEARQHNIQQLDAGKLELLLGEHQRHVNCFAWILHMSQLS